MNKRQRKKLIKKTIYGIILQEPYTNKGLKLTLKTNIRCMCGDVAILMNKGDITIEGENDNEQ